MSTLMAYFEILTCEKIYLETFQFLRPVKAGNCIRDSQCCQSEAKKEFWPSSVIGREGGTYQMKLCGWATEMMKNSSKTTVVSIKMYDKIIFTIVKYTISNIYS